LPSWIAALRVGLAEGGAELVGVVLGELRELGRDVARHLLDRGDRHLGEREDRHHALQEEAEQERDHPGDQEARAESLHLRPPPPPAG
jgi:NAD(P)-dependent dehydrogenase (short-subunit alcohol dehydrogenase family)